MDEILKALAQYGPLGLWTASLLWMNWQQRKEIKEEEIRFENARTRIQEKVIERLDNHERMLEKTLEKLDATLMTLREQQAEDRILRLKDSE